MGLEARSLYFSLSQLCSWPGNGGNAFRRCRTAHGPKRQGNMMPSDFEINTCIAWWNLKKRKGRWATVSMQVCSASVTVQSLVQIKPCLVQSWARITFIRSFASHAFGFSVRLQNPLLSFSIFNSYASIPKEQMISGNIGQSNFEVFTNTLRVLRRHSHNPEQGPEEIAAVPKKGQDAALQPGSLDREVEHSSIPVITCATPI